MFNDFSDNPLKNETDNKKPMIFERRIITGVFVVSTIFLIAYFLISAKSFPNWTGFNNKSLWDLLDLLIVPAGLALVAYIFRRIQSQAELEATKKQRTFELEISDKQRQLERSIARERENHAALQKYLDSMTDLLLVNKLRESKEDSEERSIALARTLTAFQSLEGKWKGHLLRFLIEAKLIDGEKPIINLQGADLRGAVLRGTDLQRANLQGVDLREAVLETANLEKTNLKLADLRSANLRAASLKAANLEGADLGTANLLTATLSHANLRKSKLVDADLQAANLREVDLTGATLKGADLDGADLSGIIYDKSTIWPDNFTFFPKELPSNTLNIGEEYLNDNE